MRKYSVVLCTLAILCAQLASALASGSSPEQVAEGIPPIILSGLDAYKAKGPEDAVKAWLKGSPLEGSKEALTQANGLRQVQDYYGAYLGFDLVAQRDISSSTHIYYLILNFENGPLFAKFLLYHKQQGWVLTSFLFNTKDDAILPPHLLDR